jgi:hypothetical protein
MYAPSIAAHILSGLILFVAAFVLFSNYSLIKKNPLTLVTLLFIFSIALGVHGLSHLGVEVVYGYNPWKAI